MADGDQEEDVADKRKNKNPKAMEALRNAAPLMDFICMVATKGSSENVAAILNEPSNGYVFKTDPNTATVYKPGERDETNSWMVIDEGNGIDEWGVKVSAVIQNNHGFYVEPYYSFSLGIYKA